MHVLVLFVATIVGIVHNMKCVCTEIKMNVHTVLYCYTCEKCTKYETCAIAQVSYFVHFTHSYPLKILIYACAIRTFSHGALLFVSCFCIYLIIFRYKNQSFNIDLAYQQFQRSNRFRLCHLVADYV